MLAASAAIAQIKDIEEGHAQALLGEPSVVRFRVGMEINTSRGALRDIRGAIPIPLECPEQHVQLVEESVPPELGKLVYRNVVGGEGKQAYFTMSHIPGGTKLKVYITYDVTTHKQLPPEDTESLVIPRRIPRELKRFVGPSKNINVNHRKIRGAIKEALAEVDPEATPWQRVAALYDYAFDKIEYVEMENISSVEALTSGRGDCQAVSALFVAMCRTEKIPARMVWAHEHQYAEFYLEESPTDEESSARKPKPKKPVGHWYPVESVGTHDFGGMPIARVIMQKGDNFRVPERKREQLNYAAHLLRAFPAQAGGGKPKVKNIAEMF